MLYLASDHAGFELKEKLKVFLSELGCEAEDLGAFSYDEKDDYPDFILPAARAVADDPENNRAIVLGGSGQGEAMAANRIKGVRAAVLYKYDEDIVKLAREHNDANILSLGARFLGEEEAKKAIKLWLETPFSGDERHKRRIAKLDD
ncbi:MAG: RpiB/LacA/LacB family sugar-phosphate isomerase [bacterium]|nr:RpiB/LacA/LacB family sugar-phosphate isomerase [bacterium]